MSYETRRSIVAGLPGSGKTTFLAALWGVVTAVDVDGALELVALNGDTEHLNEIRDRWADCTEIGRTQVIDEQEVSMTLRDRQNGESGELLFCDMAGESFERQWLERSWAKSYDELVLEAVGVLLFVHPRVKEALLIRDANRLVRKIASDSGAGSDHQEGGAGRGDGNALPSDGGEAPRVEFRREDASTQVQLVDLLQFVNDRRSGQGLRVSLVISAWDLVVRGERAATPEGWLAQRLPLLHQFLLANSDVFPYKVFGVSAQGGDLKDASELRKILRPSERIRVAQGKATSSDATLPVRWAMNFPERGEIS